MIENVISNKTCKNVDFLLVQTNTYLYFYLH